MELVWIVLIIISVLALISIVIAVAVVSINKGSTVNNTCVAQSDCSIGYICSNIGTGGTGTCRAGLGTSCSTNNDCATTFICTNGRCANIVPTGVTLEVPASSYKSPFRTPQITPQKSGSPPISVPTFVAASPATATPLTPNPDVTQALQETNPVVQTRQPTRLIVSNGAVTPLTPCSDTVTGTVSLPATVPTRDVKSPINVRTVIPRIPQRVQLEVTSIDDEVNSTGLIVDAPFDFRSADTRGSEDHEVSTPYEEQGGKYYCRPEMLDNEIHSPVIDVCSYSNVTVFLLKDGNVICEVQDGADKQRRRAHNNIPLNRITSFAGYLYGVGVDGKLYTLPNTYFSATEWSWDPVAWAPSDIKHISTTYDSSHLWIQTSNTGVLYKGPGTVVSQVQNFILRRVYGRDVTHYIDIDPVRFTAIIQPGNIAVNDIYDAALSYYDEIVAIHPNDRDAYHRITVVNWNPYYIRT